MLICSSRVNVCDGTSKDVKRGGGERKAFQDVRFEQTLVTKIHTVSISTGRLFNFFIMT